MAAKTMSEIKDVDLDKPGVFKYIQVQVTDKSDASNAKIIVRGYERCHYHCDIFDEIAEQVDKKLFKLKPLGGGRIKLDDKKKDICVYGYSQAYGPAKHEDSKELIEKAYPGYSVSISYDGY
ncbi:phip-1 [Pristionchus pacificus]|uniref:Sex-regulated protein janus-B n=1 Tax=Pristionchus pacificus TaxID=54126 RepID=A0A2A6C9S7_PRIPA|nr:phip-1 [Pristionchus pacificus]|eukprot:PDM74856.1 phip-1 [Pristionchus pacificus]